MFLKKKNKKNINRLILKLLWSFVLNEKKNINNIDIVNLNFYNFLELKLKNYKNKRFFFLNLKYINKKKLLMAPTSKRRYFARKLEQFYKKEFLKKKIKVKELKKIKINKIDYKSKKSGISYFRKKTLIYLIYLLNKKLIYQLRMIFFIILFLAIKFNNNIVNLNLKKKLKKLIISYNKNYKNKIIYLNELNYLNKLFYKLNKRKEFLNEKFFSLYFKKRKFLLLRKKRRLEKKKIKKLKKKSKHIFYWLKLNKKRKIFWSKLKRKKKRGHHIIKHKNKLYFISKKKKRKLKRVKLFKTFFNKIVFKKISINNLKVNLNIKLFYYNNFITNWTIKNFNLINNLSKYRWRLKEYLFLSLILYNKKKLKDEKKIYILNFYKLIAFFKKKLLLLKFKLLKRLKVLKFLKKIKINKLKNLLIFRKKKELLLNNIFFLKHEYLIKLKKNYIKKKKNLKLYTILSKTLKYFNIFLTLLLKKIILKKKIKINKNFIYDSYILNVVVKDEKVPLLSMSHFFLKNYFHSKNIAMFLFDSIFNRTNVVTIENINKLYSKNLYEKRNESIKKKNTKQFYFNYLSSIKTDYLMLDVNNKRNKINLTNIKKKKKNYLYLKILNFYNYIYIYKKKYANSLKNLKLNNINCYKSIFNLNIFNKLISINELLFSLINLYEFINIKIYNKSILILLYFYILFYNNLKIKNYLVLNNKEKKKNIYIKNIKLLFKIKLKKIKLKYMQFTFIKYIHFIINFLFKIINIITNFISYIKQSNYSKLKRYLNFLKKKTNIFNYNRFSNNLIFAEYWKKKYIITNIINYDQQKLFFFNLSQNKIYSNYSRRNRNNFKKCIITFLEKRSNVFFVLSWFKTKKVIRQASGGFVLDRTYFNSKRQKKGTRCITKLLEKEFKPLIKKLKLKKLYVIAQGGWNFRVNHITKYWVVRYKLGLKYLQGVKIYNKLAHHKGLKKSNKRRK